MELRKEVRISKKKIHPPFGYFGSKNKIAFQLSENLPPHNCWVEAFCGSAALTLRKLPAPIEVINDIDNEIVNFFQQLRNSHKELSELLELTPYAEQELVNARVNKIGLSELERARRFLVQSMMAINGVFGQERGGFSYSDSYSRNGVDARVNRWNNLPNRIDDVVKRLKQVRIENKDARKLLKRYLNRPATLVYLDPPYFADRTNGYNVDDTNNETFHTELLGLACQAKCMVFVSGYDHELYNSILTKKEGWGTKKIETHTKDSKGKIHNRTEVIWMNRYFQNAQNSGSLPIVLTKEEQKHNKLNPER